VTPTAEELRNGENGKFYSKVIKQRLGPKQGVVIWLGEYDN
jgi:hypothetical protein